VEAEDWKPDRTKLPIPLSPFEGEIRKSYRDAEAAWQHPVAALKGAPNVKVNGKPVAKGNMKATVGGRFGIDTFGIGEDSGQPVTFDYKPPFKFTGTIEKVTIEVK